MYVIVFTLSSILRNGVLIGKKEWDYTLSLRKGVVPYNNQKKKETVITRSKWIG